MGIPTPQYSAAATGRLMMYQGNEVVAVGLGAGVGAFLVTPSSAALAAAVTDETGTGALVFATSPALVTPNLGTPSAVTLTNGTGLPISTGVSGLGANVATFLATPSSANLAAALTDETGTGAAVFATSPTITTPTIAQINNTAGVIIAGTNTNDDAAAGKVGEYVQSIVASGSAVALTTGTQTNITSISLTAGDWDVTSAIYFALGATTSITRLISSVSQTSATLDLAAGHFADWEQAAAVPGGNQISSHVSGQRFSLSGTTTIYLVAFAAFTVSTCSGWGKISARRVR